MKSVFIGAACASAALLASAGHAQDTAAGSDAAPTVAPICTDRPTKGNVACTVPSGAFQLETDAINWTRLEAGGTRTDTILYTNPTLKYGLGSHTDIEVNIAPYETVRRGAGGDSDRIGGVGDLYVRLKQRLTDDSSKTQVALIPFVKAPTAKLGVGNNRWEGGVAVPVIVPLPSGFTLNLGPEVDVYADSDGSGHHVNLTSLINLSHAVGTNMTVYAEFWNAQNLDPAGTIRQYSADAAASYLLTPLLQIDVGGNFGLNRATPDAQLYAGLSTRF
jgi:hypothetical protein